MTKTEKTTAEKEAIITEYLLGQMSYRQLGLKHGIDFRLIHSWVTKFKGKPLSQRKSKKENQQQSTIEPLPTDVKLLQEQLRKSKLHVELLNTMIDIAEDQLKISIRKKSGTKR
jgi:transposase-like protein